MISWVSMYDIICIIEPNATSSMSSAATSYMIEEVAANAFDKLNAIKKSVSNIQALFATVVMAGATIFATCLSLGPVRLFAKKAYDIVYYIVMKSYMTNQFHRLPE